jgi:hypothetical protein
MDRRALIAHIAVIAMLGVTVVALTFGVDVTLVDQPGVYMRMPAQVADWHGDMLLYCHDPSCRWAGTAADTPDHTCPECHADTFTMAQVEKDQLPPDTEFLKYLYRHPSGRELLVSIVLSGNARNSIHRPQRCLVAQGYNITRSHVEKMALPQRAPLKVMLLDTLHQFGPRRDAIHARPVSFAYWFVGQKRETPSHLKRMFWLAWDRVWHGVAHRWVYIMVHGQDRQESTTFARDLQEFIPAWYPTILR